MRACTHTHTYATTYAIHTHTRLYLKHIKHQSIANNLGILNGQRKENNYIERHKKVCNTMVALKSTKPTLSLYFFNLFIILYNCSVELNSKLSLSVNTACNQPTSVLTVKSAVTQMKDIFRCHNHGYILFINRGTVQITYIQLEVIKPVGVRPTTPDIKLTISHGRL